ncbi:MAG TPA: sigma-54-dependent Fis family transcriptional regulator [Oceanospirillales bacterium]|nr:sigma-54-dependent Fis family transcriptional regulator [Oceanospirillaceae bacterium]HBS42211.1 sigma-54-dependent Fis family transcriptional regulator [Oceanospirillales bacterium]|tara:strand:- start:580 stop:1947 length:1368 start_codon:yes stop_codon:yes gene_type:complete
MRILVVEDDPRLREAIVDTLMLKQYDVTEAKNGKEAVVLLQDIQPDLVLTDINMPEMTGLELLTYIKQEHPWLPVLLMTAYGDVSQAVQAMQQGADDYLMKPFELRELDALLSPYTQSGDVKVDESEPVCEAAVSQQLFQLAKRVAQTDSTVLISGESGTGKEVLARYIHQNSQRKKAPFIAINCAAIPENMLEAMLFGYEKGAFTGAYQTMPGKFEQADGGTLLLDEITEMDPALQAKLLRVLQERQVERLGGKKTIDLNVRIVATTNRELADYVAEGNFREDLYYRLTVFPLKWLPLRERRDDILPLARRLLAHHAGKMKRPVPRMSSDAEQKLLNHSWPGNVRELDNTIQRSLILQTGNLISAHDFTLTPVPKNRQIFSSEPEPVLHEQKDPEGVLGNDLKHREAELIAKALREEPSRKDAAERLGISPRTLRYKVAKLREEGVDVEGMVAC